MKQEKIKELIKTFLKPDWKKVAFFVGMMIITFIPQYSEDPIKVGIPLPYYEQDLICLFAMPGEFLECSSKFHPLNLILDIIFWYFISCLIVSTYEKVKRK